MYFKLRFCNLCGFPIIRINKSVFGLRCIKCRSSFIHRALGKVITELNLSKDAIVHEFSNHGAIFNYLKNNFKNLTTSEYFDGIASGDFKDGVQCQDVQHLTLPHNHYNLMTSTEVFEHVPNDIKGFKNIYNCLKKGGYFAFTVPLTETEKTVERAILENGEIKHLLEPEYHGDHLRSKGILAFRNYGFDIAERLKSVGFSDVKMPLIDDTKFAVEPAKRVIVAKK
ncbi:MAG: class I SAM-dependent methyltransferase [Bacteroidia bacterium]